MRAKVVLSASVLALLILVPAIYVRFKPATSESDQNVSAPTPEKTVVVSAAPAPVVSHPPRAVRPADEGQGAATMDSSAMSHEDYVAARTAELTEKGMSDDPADLKTILSELNNKDPDLRKAALAAVVQFGSKEAIPALQNEISWTEDPQEKVDLLEAIKVLQLPSFREYQASAAAAASQPPNDQPQPSNN